MLDRVRTGLRLAAAGRTLTLLAAPGSMGRAEEKKEGLRVFTCGHSFHVFVPAILTDLARGSNIQGHTQVGLSAIGGSRVIQHWDVPDDKFKSKEALKSGKVDVLTLSPI